ncbi:MAG TPA: amidohydrolase family protein [Bryobacteraceae bacterium]|jgi:predicted TIM-barrel fold metal-dependent hydrolase|nr:amidohydrolase family protein [Bryobacteraceae bacterium]
MIASPWGPLAVSDAHVHFFSRNFFSSLAAQKPGMTIESIGQTLGWPVPGDDPATLAAAWVAELDRHGVNRAALIASAPGDEHSVEAAVAAYPRRFFGYAMINPLAQDAVARVQGALDRNRLHGVCLFPAMHRYPINGEAASAILDVIHATRPHTIVFVHCGALSVGVRDKLGLPSLFDLRYSNPVDLHAVALRYPQLRFVIPHFGAGYFREALMVADLCSNVYLDTSSSNRWMQYDPALLDLRTVFRRTLDLLGPRRLLFGTDSSFFPRGWHAAIFESQAKAVYELGISGHDAALIFGGNLERLMGAAG